MKGSIATHVMLTDPKTGRKARVTRGFWDEYCAAKSAKRKLPTLPTAWFK